MMPFGLGWTVPEDPGHPDGRPGPSDGKEPAMAGEIRERLERIECKIDIIIAGGGRPQPITMPGRRGNVWMLLPWAIGWAIVGGGLILVCMLAMAGFGRV